MTVRITEFVQADRPRWTELWRAYLAFYETTLPDGIYEHTWSRIMAEGEIRGLAARDANTIVGITHYLFHPHGWSVTPACYLQDLFVDPAIRGQGAGRLLIEAVAGKARNTGATRLYWMTQDTNATARLLYDRLARHSGFIRYEYPL